MNSSTLDDLFGDDSDDDCTTTATNIGKSFAAAEIRELSTVGGGRGLFAVTDLPSGQLILSEIPSFSIPADVTSDPAQMQTLLVAIAADPLAMDVARHLHPRNINDVSSDELRKAKDSIGDVIITSIAEESHLSTDEVLLIFLVLQHNGFSSGLYKQLSIANHSCSPNCIKFTPRSSSFGASEIWTTQPIKSGEELCICYCNPMEQSASAMQSYLRQNHFFECQCPKCVSETNQYAGCDEAHNLVQEYERQLHAMEGELLWLELNDSLTNLKTASAMIIAVDFLLNKTIFALQRLAATYTLSPQLLSREFKLAVAASAACVQELGNLPNDVDISALKVKSKYVTGVDDAVKLENEPKESTSLLHYCIESYLSNSAQLFLCQQQYLHRDHCDFATTCLDLEQGLQLALKHISVAAFESLVQQSTITACLASVAEVTHCTEDNSKLDNTVQNQTELIERYTHIFHVEGERLRALYSLHRNFPRARLALRQPGDCYWAPFVGDK